MCALFGKKKNLLPPANSKAGSLVMNDKLVVIAGITATDIDVILQRFCKLYRRNDYRLLIKVHSIEERIIALTFPDDIDFVVFFYLIKNLTYPSDGESSAKVLGWCTLLPIETTNPVSKQVMVYGDESNASEKPVFVTTYDNTCWKIDFNKNRYEAVSLIQNYTRPPYSYLEIKHREGYIID